MPPPSNHDIQNARRNVGEDPVARVRWLLKFAGLQEISEEQPLKLQVLLFMGADQDAAQGRLPTTSQLQDWQSKVRTGLTQMSRGSSWKIEIEGSLGVTVVRGRVQETSIRSPSRRDHWSFTYKAIQTIIDGLDHLRFCARNDCAQPYMRNRRQEYCSGKCRSTINKRRYRQSLKVHQ